MMSKVRQDNSDTGEGGDFAAAVASVQLIDHHVHGALRHSPSRPEFESMINEGFPGTPPASMNPFDSQLGFALRRYAAPLLGCEAGVPADTYWAARSSLPEGELNARLLSSCGVSDWLIDTGYRGEEILSANDMTPFGAKVHEVVRLETVAETLLASRSQEGSRGSGYADAFREAFAIRTADPGVIAVKSVIAYRGGFDIDWSRPTDAEVNTAGTRWLAAVDTDTAAEPALPRLSDPVLLRFGIWTALDRGLPIQFHVGFGDRDVDLRTANPLHLRPFLFAAETAGVSILLLHCYPFVREAGVLAQSFGTVWFDTGEANNYVGVRTRSLVAQSLEMAPFSRVLYSSDAWGPAELHYLASVLWRRAFTTVVGEWVTDGDWMEADAIRVATMIARDNARTAYGI